MRRRRPCPNVALVLLVSTAAHAQSAPPPPVPAGSPPPVQPAPANRGLPPPHPFPAADAAAPSTPAPSIVIVDATSSGVDPVVGRVVTNELARTAADMGFPLLPPDAGPRALRGRAPGSSADLWQVTQSTGARMALHASATARSGRYVIRVEIAMHDGSGPFVANGSAGQNDIRAVARDLTRSLLLPHAPKTPPLATPTTHGAVPAEPAEEPWEERFRLAFQTEGVIGLSDNFFYNHLLGGRLDYRVTRQIAFGPYVGYANMKGPDGRSHMFLPYAQLEYRIDLSNNRRFGLPMRLASGYLPRNGPMVRLAGGLSYEVNDGFFIHADLLTPTIWIVRDRVVGSLDVAIELSFDL